MTLEFFKINDLRTGLRCGRCKGLVGWWDNPRHTKKIMPFKRLGQKLNVWLCVNPLVVRIADGRFKRYDLDLVFYYKTIIIINYLIFRIAIINNTTYADADTTNIGNTTRITRRIRIESSNDVHIGL